MALRRRSPLLTCARTVLVSVSLDLLAPQVMGVPSASAVPDSAAAYSPRRSQTLYTQKVLQSIPAFPLTRFSKQSMMRLL